MFEHTKEYIQVKFFFYTLKGIEASKGCSRKLNTHYEISYIFAT